MSEEKTKESTRFTAIVTHPLIVAVVTLILTALLTHYLTEKRLRAEFARTVADRDTTSMEKARDEITRLLDTRLWRTRRLIQFSVRRGTRREYVALLADYRKAVDEWNKNLNRNLTLVEQYFGAELRDELENRIGKAFQNLNADMAVERKTPLSELNRQIDVINDLVANFGRNLSAKIQERRAKVSNGV